MSFLTPIFLLGALAAAIPILVHLVRRTRARRVEFASLMFVRRIEQKTIRRRRLRNLLLLALRCAALLLLALAFARPYFSGSRSEAAGLNRGSIVILIDGSFSMRYGDAFDRARRAARDVLSNAGTRDQIALVLFSQSYDVVRPLKTDHAEASTLLDRIQPALGATDYLQAIGAADALLKEADSRERKIYLISDFQQAGWNRAAPPVKLSPGVKFFPVDVSDREPSNLAVVEIKAEPVVYAQKYPGKVTASVGNFSGQPKDSAVEFKLNDLTVERRQMKLDAGARQTIEFSGFNVPEGSNRATVEISGDGFPIDNRRFFAIKRMNQSKVVAIETAVRGRSESFFLQQSLMAGENNPYSFTAKTAGAINPAELGDYRVVIVNDVAGISESLVAALKKFVEGGGGLILAAGKHTEAGEFNRVFAGIEPAQLGDTVQTRGGYALMSQVKTDHPIFSLFAKGGRLTSTRVYAYHRSIPNDGSSVIAALDDASPVIIEGRAGRGNVMLVTTSLDTGWSDLPITPVFLPLMRQMLEYLGGRERDSAFIVGQYFTAAPDGEGLLPAIESPAGGRVEDAAKSASGELSVNASEIGFYRLRYRDHVEQVAVSLDGNESDLSKLNVDELAASVTRDANDAGAQPAPAEQLSPEQIEARQRLWLPLLLAALGLFVAEALLARRIRLAKLVG